MRRLRTFLVRVIRSERHRYEPFQVQPTYGLAFAGNKKGGIECRLHKKALISCELLQLAYSGGPEQPGPIKAGIFVLMIGKFSASAFFSIHSAYSGG